MKSKNLKLKDLNDIIQTTNDSTNQSEAQQNEHIS